ncbi:hypothetical protein, partial [Burkholderia ubonensis]|uniref:hypothetical protein n=1 Tax=Burkholderia ubonensis TaxID=101571 RepID=UPI001C43033D
APPGGPDGGESGCSAWAARRCADRRRLIQKLQVYRITITNSFSPDGAAPDRPFFGTRYQNQAIGTCEMRIIPGTGAIFSSDE